MVVLVGLWFIARRASKRALEVPSIPLEDVRSVEAPVMPAEITELRELMESYRCRSKSVPFQPIAAAYADVADHLEEIISHKLSVRVVRYEARMKVSECMTRDVLVAQADQPIRNAAQFMLKVDADSIPVCEGDRLIGMITDRDLAVRAVAEGRGPETPLREIMTHDVVCCFEDEDVENAVQKMSENKVRRLPILSRNDEKLVGIVSLGDITHSNARLAEHALEQVTQPSPLHDQSRER
jgi:CBS domain-containing protein